MPGAGCSWYMRRLCSCYQRKMIFKIFDCQIKWHVRKLGSKAIKSEIQMPIGHCQVRSALWDICVWCAVVVDIDVSRVCLSVCLCVCVCVERAGVILVLYGSVSVERLHFGGAHPMRTLPKAEIQLLTVGSTGCTACTARHAT